MMEKTTNIADPTTDDAWLRLAIGVLARTTGDDVLTGGDVTGAALKPQRRPETPIVPRTGFGPHFHAGPELCLALSGRAYLQLNDTVFDFAPPRIAIIPPGLSHMEARVSPRQPYVILWLSPTSESLLMHASRHRGERGWDSVWRLVFPDVAASRITRAVTTPTPETQAPLLADLLALFAEAHRQVVRRTAPPASPHDALLEHVRVYLDTHLAEPVTVAQVAAVAGFTPNHLNTMFRRHMGKGIHAYLVERRMEKAMALCHRGDLLIKQVAAAVGYPDPLYFSRAFQRHHGRWPSEVARHP